MKRVTIFGKPGGGKSVLAKKLSVTHGINYFPLDLIEYAKNGERVSREQYITAHNDLVELDSWIIDGLGLLNAFWERIEVADTIIFVDLPYRVHYWWVLKRYLMSFYTKPVGWPEGSSVLKGTLAGWKYLGLSRKFWTDDMLQKIKEKSTGKELIHVTSVQQLNHIVLDNVTNIK